MDKGSVNIWMQLLGFERNDRDKGVGRFLENTGFIPDSICGLLFNADFVHLHKGMNEEYELFPDNCSYRGVLRNRERERQPWTNYDLRTLVKGLKDKGIKFYAGIMGCYLKNRFHHEWLSDHHEMQSFRIEGDGELCCLKHLSDGRLYEDFFAEMLVKTLCDYDMAGVHLSDAFCPINVLYSGDISTDMVQQFLSYTGVVLPFDIETTLGDDSVAARNKRHQYIWGELREEWIRFYEWRWRCFFKKICDAVHAVGKEVWVLGMYCTDPFETRYIYGFDCKGVMKAGVDCITANILPTSVTLESPDLPYYFHRMHTITPLLKAHVGNRKIVGMVGVQDASEEWSVLEHFPTMLERDAYTQGSYIVNDGECSRALDGAFLCLGDGISKSGWQFLNTVCNNAFSKDVKRSLSPLIFWSEHQHDAILTEYIKTRRASMHKQCFEIEKEGALFGGTLTAQGLDNFEGVLFVPNYDLLSDEEKQLLASVNFPLVGTVANQNDIPQKSTFDFADNFGDGEFWAFVCNAELSDDVRLKIEELASKDDGLPSRKNDVERKIYPLYDELPFSKISAGFIKAVAEALRQLSQLNTSVNCDRPVRITELSDGTLRLNIYNPFDKGYTTAAVTSKLPIKSVDIVSSFPVLPPRFLSEGESGMYYDFYKTPTTERRFTVKLPPNGMTVLDVKL